MTSRDGNTPDSRSRIIQPRVRTVSLTQNGIRHTRNSAAAARPRAIFAMTQAMGKATSSVSTVAIAENAALILPLHGELDRMREEMRGSAKIGTTGRGIGPAYMDKVGRLGIRVQDVFDESILRQKVEGSLRQKNELLVKLCLRHVAAPRFDTLGYGVGFGVPQCA